jgi:hypothetical protein
MARHIPAWGSAPGQNPIPDGGLKARPIPRSTDGAGLQPFETGVGTIPGALPRSGM